MGLRGQRELDARARLARVRDADRAAVELDRELAEREAEPAATAAAAAGGLIEAVEYVRGVRRGDAGTGVADADLHPAVLSGIGLDGRGAPARRVLDGVG